MAKNTLRRHDNLMQYSEWNPKTEKRREGKTEQMLINYSL